MQNMTPKQQNPLETDDSTEQMRDCLNSHRMASRSTKHITKSNNIKKQDHYLTVYVTK